MSFETGVLNVFTDLPESIIKVDGLIVGKESITKLPLEVGEHYVQVTLNDQLVYAEKTIISANRSTTVVSEHFVDIITNTPSRGAIDREAARVRESRGNLAFGYTLKTTLQDAISIKWWAWNRFGIQGFAGGEVPDTEDRGLFGARIFASPADKIYEDDIITGTIFAGVGSYSNTTKSGQAYTEFGINIEAFVGKLVKDFMFERYRMGFASSRKKTVTKKTNKKGSTKTSYKYEEDYADTLRDLAIVLLTNLGHTNFEVSLVQLPDKAYETSFSTGIHFYF